MKIGYARTSTVDQIAGVKRRSPSCGQRLEELLHEQVSSVASRSEFERALKFVRKGDTLVVTKVDRLLHARPE